MQNLINFLENHSVNYAFISGVLLTALIVEAIILIVVYLRLNEAKISLKRERSFNKLSMQTVEDYEHQLKLNECKEIELKKAYEDAVAEITELRSKNKEYHDSLLKSYDENAKQDEHNGLLIDQSKELKERITYWKERALHQKHTKNKKFNSDLYLCIKSIGEYFIEGKTYYKATKGNNFLYLIGETKLTYIVNPSHFRPV